jgi:hypothetical protein
MTLAIPSFVEKHGDPVVRQFVHVARRLFEHRADLHADLTDRFGEVLLPAFRELLERPIPRRRKGETEAEHDKRRADAEDYKRRRADRMQAACSVLGVLLGCCDWVSMEIRDPVPGRGFLSVARLAELAGLPLDGPPGDRDAGDRTERALRMLRMAKIVPFTKHQREELADGRYVSRPALRKLAVGFFRKVGGALWQIFERRRVKVKARAEREKERAAAAGRGQDLRTRSLVGGLARGSKSSPPPPPSPPRPGFVPPEVIDAIAAERPDLTTLGDLVAEALRRRGSYDTS